MGNSVIIFLDFHFHQPETNPQCIKSQMLMESKAVCFVDYLKPYINKNLRIVRLVYFKERVIFIFVEKFWKHEMHYTVTLVSTVMTMVYDW